MKFKLLLTILSSLLLLNACTPGPVKGCLFSNIRFEGTVNPENNVPETKMGLGCINSVLGLFNWGDASIGSIAQQAGITQVSKVDHSSMGVIIFVYRRYCTVVRGS